MDDIVFESIKDLYNRLLPALKSKNKLLKNEGYNNIREQDIWEYMYYTKWNNETGITLSDMVSDILHEENKHIYEYYQRKVLEDID